MKICKKCKKEQPIENYYKNKLSKGGIISECKSCYSKRSKEYREKFPEKRAEIKKRSRLKNVEKYKKRELENGRTYYQIHKEEIRKKRKERGFKRKESLQYKLRHVLRSRIRQAIKHGYKSANTLELIGCSIEELKQHLEKLFKEGMTWENWSFYGWHIDHIIPCSSFNLLLEEEQKKCFHYTNLQPLWMKENLEKGKKISNH